MRISDWSSDVALPISSMNKLFQHYRYRLVMWSSTLDGYRTCCSWVWNSNSRIVDGRRSIKMSCPLPRHLIEIGDRQRGVYGKMVTGRQDIGECADSKINNEQHYTHDTQLNKVN